MPCLSPDRRRAQVQLVMTIAVSDHARPLSKDKAARRHMIARRLLFRTAAHFNTVLWVSFTARPKALCGGGLSCSNSLA